MELLFYLVYFLIEFLKLVIFYFIKLHLTNLLLLLVACMVHNLKLILYLIFKIFKYMYLKNYFYFFTFFIYK